MAYSHKNKHILTKIMATALFCAVAIIWLIADRISKIICNAYTPGDVIVPEVVKLFEFKLAHNTGAAWSMFSNSTVLLGFFSVLVCLGLVAYLFIARKGEAHTLEVLGLSLVFAGGLGNAYDRFVYGYVVDFINATFIDFPIFNIADIGVTCGAVLFMIGAFFCTRETEMKGEDTNV